MKPDWKLRSDEVEAGCVLWLGTKDETITALNARGGTGVPVTNVKTKAIGPNGMFNHPIIVLSRPAAQPYRIYFVCVTSFHGRTLVDRFPPLTRCYNRQHNFIPISPAPDHPLLSLNPATYRTLCLEHGDSMEKASYVNVSEIYCMDWRDAQHYWGAYPTLRRQWKLTQGSLERLHVAVKIIGEAVFGKQYQCPTLPTTASPKPRNYQHPKNLTALHAPPQHSKDATTTFAVGEESQAERLPLLPPDDRPNRNAGSADGFESKWSGIWCCLNGIGIGSVFAYIFTLSKS